MIIYLLDELIAKCALESDEPKFIDIFESLTDVRKYGCNFILGDRKIIHLLSLNKNLAPHARLIYCKIHQNYTTEMAIISSCSFRFEIGINYKTELNYHKIDIEHLTLPCFLNPNHLLVENPKDTALYVEILNYYKVLKGITNVECEFGSMNGGGNTIHEEYSRITMEKKCFTLCLIDSDKISPSGELGSTAKKFLDEPISTSWGFFSILKVHEIENLIPLKIYKQFINENHSTNASVLSRLTFSNDCDLFNYLDLKNGINKKRFLELCTTSQNYYKIKFNLDSIDFECSCEKIKDCKCFIFYPLGRSILKQIMDFIEKERLQLADHINNSLIPIYMEIGNKLFDIYCKPRPLKTI